MVWHFQEISFLNRKEMFPLSFYFPHLIAWDTNVNAGTVAAILAYKDRLTAWEQRVKGVWVSVLALSLMGCLFLDFIYMRDKYTCISLRYLVLFVMFFCVCVWGGCFVVFCFCHKQPNSNLCTWFLHCSLPHQLQGQLDCFFSHSFIPMIESSRIDFPISGTQIMWLSWLHQGWGVLNLKEWPKRPLDWPHLPKVKGNIPKKKAGCCW